MLSEKSQMLKSIYCINPLVIYLGQECYKLGRNTSSLQGTERFLNINLVVVMMVRPYGKKSSSCTLKIGVLL